MIGIHQIYRGLINQSPQPVKRKNKVTTAQRRIDLVSFAYNLAVTTEQLSNYLSVTENTVRNDIRVLIKKGRLTNESTYGRAYLVRAA